MAITVKKPAIISTWPKDVICSHCGSEMSIGSYTDISYDSWGKSFYITCPECRSRIVIDPTLLSGHEQSLIIATSQHADATSYYDK